MESEDGSGSAGDIQEKESPKKKNIDVSTKKTGKGNRVKKDVTEGVVDRDSGIGESSC